MSQNSIHSSSSTLSDLGPKIYFSLPLYNHKVPGSSPGGSREFEGGGTESASLEKYIFNYRYIERLETDSVVGSLVEKKRLNNLD